MRIMQVVTDPESRRQKAWAFMGAAVLMLAVVWIQTLRFDDQNYREDEINTVHAVQVLSNAEITRWLALEGTHPPGWRWVAAEWVRAFGGERSIVRFQSSLFTLLALACIFRLGADVFDTQVGLIAIAFLGFQPFFHWFMHELRPYPLLVFLVAAQHVVFLRWLKYQNFAYALTFVGLGVMAFQTHYFAVYVFAAYALLIPALVRFERVTYLRGFGLVAAMGLSVSAWILPVIYGAFVVREAGLNYDYSLATDVAGLQILFTDMQMLPVVVLPALAIPVATIFPYFARAPYALDEKMRLNGEWRRWYVIVLPLAMMLIALLVNIVVRNLSSRNMIIVTPSLAIVAGFVVRALAWRWRIAVLILVVGAGLGVYHRYAQNVPYDDMFAFMNESEFAGDGVVTAVSRGSVGTTEMVYMLLEERRGEWAMQDIFSVSEQGVFSTYQTQADPLVHFKQDAGTASLREFDTFLQSRSHLWFITYSWVEFYGESDLAVTYRAYLEMGYEAVREKQFPLIHRGKDLGFYTIVEFQRRPAPYLVG